MIRIGDLYVVDSGTEFGVEVEWPDGGTAVIECDSRLEAEECATLWGSQGRTVRRKWYLTAWEDINGTASE
jgi:hypothetical protein